MKFIIALIFISVAVSCFADLVIVGPEGQVAGIGRQGIYARDREGQIAGVGRDGTTYARDRDGQTAGTRRDRNGQNGGTTAYAKDRAGQVAYQSPKAAYARDKHGNTVADIY